MEAGDPAAGLRRPPLPPADHRAPLGVAPADAAAGAMVARFLGPAPFGPAAFGRPWAWLGRLYAAVHSAAAFRCLRELARSLGGDA